jgi:rRNA maturation endonuclease Nob1
MTQTNLTTSHTHHSHGDEQGKPGQNAKKIHRVCIGCNNMFEVTMENYEAKHCPACHKA